MSSNQRPAMVRNGSPDTPGEALLLGRTRRKAIGLARPERPARKATLVIASPLSESGRRWTRRLQDGLDVCEITERRALERVMANLKPDVLVIDLALPGLRRVRGLSDMQRLSPSTRIVALTDAQTDSEGVLALEAGARGYCARTIDPHQLEKAVAAVQKGEIWATRKLVPRLIAELLSLIDRLESLRPQSKADPRLGNLTGRQRVIADLISQGACNKEIAEQLNITERTVKAHLTEAFRNVGVSHRIQLALLFKAQRQESE